ncbi:hypothetical protein [Lysobacter sp. Root604]|uniref:hypothetical protein n=1 Tax=Lysobacter sp. Root604 TaxID=1736568 RepID=UPI0012FC8BE2|nr:hypothetical protein [Lysobacter sp. Root604]
MSDGRGTSMSSAAFDHIIEATRERFLASESEIVAAIYKPYDHEGMMFISLVDSPPEMFRAFCRAALRARAESPHAALFKAEWGELCDQLALDSRAKVA